MELLIGLLVTLLAANCGGLQLTQLKVPSQVDLREKVTLTCIFNLENEGLYSIKWYKDDYEFYRYMPDNRPPDMSFPTIGVHLDDYKSNSSMTVIRLNNLSFKSSGTYRCEVSAEAPSFQTVIGASNMTVMVLPEHEPLIDGVRSEYPLGDYIIGNCTSAPSSPVASLTWFINGNKAESWLLLQYPVHSDIIDNVRVFTKTLGLRIQSFKQHFLGSGHKLKLSCIATIGERSWQRIVSSTLANNLTNQKLAQERLGNTASSVSSYLSVSLAILLMTSHVLS